MSACSSSDDPESQSAAKSAPAESKASTPPGTSDNKQAYPANVYFGDTHLHTSLSMDAGAFGNRLGLDPAYRFTRGEEVTTSTGLQARMERPLDFVVIADHSDGMGFFDMFASGDPLIMEKEEGRRWNKAIEAGGDAAGKAAMELITLFSQ